MIDCRFIIPESPRWLLCKGRTAEVAVIIKKACVVNKRELPANFEKLLKSPPPMKDENDDGCISLFGTPYLRLITICFLCIWFTMNLVYYGLILNMNKFGGNVYFNSVSKNETTIYYVHIHFCIASTNPPEDIGKREWGEVKDRIETSHARLSMSLMANIRHKWQQRISLSQTSPASTVWWMFTVIICWARVLCVRVRGLSVMGSPMVLQSFQIYGQKLTALVIDLFRIHSRYGNGSVDLASIHRVQRVFLTWIGCSSIQKKNDKNCICAYKLFILLFLCFLN